jgi:uncharacterized protein DUF732
MAGEAVSGRYGAARHAVADEDGSRCSPAPDERSLVDRLLAGGGDEPAFDWGWGDPATGELVSDRGALHDIPELWGQDDRPARDVDAADGDEEKPFPTPRLHGESSQTDERDWTDRGLDDGGLGSDDRGHDEWEPLAAAADDWRPDPEFGDDPLDALSTPRVHAENDPFGDRLHDRDGFDRGPTHDVLMDGDDRSPFVPPVDDRDPLNLDRPERKLVDTDPRLRRWADRDRPSGSPRDDGDGVEVDADPFSDPAFAESVLTGRIRIPDADAFEEERPQAPGPLDVGPEPTTAFSVAAPATPALPLDEYAARRRAAEEAAASAEAAAASAAERASAAIAAAARAAEEAEAAAEAAAQAAAQANAAAQAEVRAIADAVARGEGPGRQNGRADAPEPPTQAVPLIAPARAPGRRPPPRRPAGPAPRAAHQNAPLRDVTDGEATAVLTGLDALRDPVRPRRSEPAPAEVTTIARRQPAVEPVHDADDEPGEPDDRYDQDHHQNHHQNDDDHDDDEPEERGIVGRLTSRPVLAAIGVGAVLVLAAVVVFFTASEPEATPAEATPAAVSAPVAPQQPEPATPAVDLHSKKAVSFLTALRDADIPTTSSGQAEVEAADAICSQLDQGADEAQLARSVPAVLPNVTRGQANDVVDYAKRFYC